MKKTALFLNQWVYILGFAFICINNSMYAQTSGTVTAGNWYRIASNSGNRANASFTLRDFIPGGGHSTLEFRAGISYNYQAGISFTLLNHNYYANPTFTKIRILEKDTYDPQYIEVYTARSGSVNFSIYDNLQTSGWDEIAWTPGSIPAGYTSREYDVNKLFVVGDYDDRFTVDRGGNVGIGVTGPSEKLQVDGKIYSSNGGFKFPDGTVQSTATIWTPVEEFGAVGNGITDDRIAIQQAINSGKQVSLSPNKTYLVKSTLIIGERKTLYIPASTTLLFDGDNATSTAIIVNDKSNLIGRGKVQSNRSGWDWNNAKIGIWARGVNIKVDIGWIEGFEYGIYLGGNFSVACSNFNIGCFTNCVINILIYPTEDNFVNQNYFHNDNIYLSWHTVQPDVWEHSCGIYMDWTGSNEPNSNTFSGTIEQYKIGILLAGAFNRLEGLRLEGCNTKIRIIGSETRCNNLFGEYDNATDWVGKIENLTGHNLEDVLQYYGIAGSTLVNNIAAEYYYTVSDSTLKENIQTVTGALNKILSLRGTSFKFKSAAKEGGNSSEETYGFIAQELKEVLPKLVIKRPVDSLYEINYDGVIPVLVEAFKEQHSIIENQQAEIDELKNKIKDVNGILKELNLTITDTFSLEENKATLFQNVPNPFNRQTEIRYFIPYSAGEAYILIFDMNGRYIRSINVEAKGESSIVIKENTFDPGMYIYTLVVDNKEVGTKRMVLTE